ncbi:hypothetical protein [Nonomuraea sp. NPDC050310]|uniref:hypothetical protein n=1 Tax=unclassified Nonomuraea TaxID=2593643 RepID=UPI003403661C
MSTQLAPVPPRRGTSPVYRLILIVILLAFALAAQAAGMATEVAVLLISTAGTTALHVLGRPLPR